MLESLLVAFPVIALAELGDKTQLMTLYLSARYRRPAAVSLGLLAGAALNVGLAVLGGALLHRLLGDQILALLVGAAFVGAGLWILLFDGPGDGEDEALEQSHHGAFLTTLWLFFVMEMGDKTQLAVVGLAAALASPTGVFVGATLGLAAANLPAVWLGHRYASRLPRATLNRISGVVFVLVGAALLIYRIALAGA
jgi:putative Ca2+/H+ antiporter (TMEM165/GDT1 family)